jgi:hypothetical protein
MPRKKEISADDLLAVMGVIFDVAELDLPDLPFDFDDPDIDLSAFPPPLSSVLGKKPASDAKMLPVSGSHSICIRVPARVIRAYKLRALATGSNYQTLMNRAMAAAAKDFV